MEGSNSLTQQTSPGTSGGEPVVVADNRAVLLKSLPKSSSSGSFIFLGYGLFVVICISLVVLLAVYGPPPENVSTEQSLSEESSLGLASSFERIVSPSEERSVTLTEENFSLAKSTWSSKFPSDDSSLPRDSYRVIYFDRSNAQGTNHITQHGDIFLNYGMDEQDRYNISAEKLAVYWVGKKTISKTMRYKIIVDSGWSSARVMVDKKVIFEGTQGKEVWVTLEQGEHLVEVEFLSAWHVPSLAISFLSEEEINKRGSQKETDVFISNVPVWYVGIYEPEQNEVELILPKNKGEITLLLSSYERTSWKVRPAQGTKVTSAFVSSYKEGSSVDTGDLTTKVAYGKENSYLGVYELYPKCGTYFQSSTFYCEGLDDYNQLFQTVGQLSNGATITTFTGAYSTSSMSLPSQYLAPDERQKLDAYSAKMREEWRLFQEKQRQVN